MSKYQAAIKFAAISFTEICSQYVLNSLVVMPRRDLNFMRSLLVIIRENQLLIRRMPLGARDRFKRSVITRSAKLLIGSYSGMYFVECGFQGRDARHEDGDVFLRLRKYAQADAPLCTAH